MKKFSILSSLTFVITILSCISCGYLISSAVISTFGYSSTVASQKTKVYAISMQNSTNPTDLEATKTELQSQNGAGYVYNLDNNYHLIASLYENINDAELVKNNLKSSGITSEILTIEIPSKSVQGNFSAEEKTILSNTLKSNFDSFKSLYDIAISLDTGVFDKSRAKLESNNVYSNHIAIKTNFETFFESNNNLDIVAKSVEKTSQFLSDLVCENYATSTQTFSSLIKLTYCKILLS